jgi:hypothetical protein
MWNLQKSKPIIRQFLQPIQLHLRKAIKRRVDARRGVRRLGRGTYRNWWILKGIWRLTELGRRIKQLVHIRIVVIYVWTIVPDERIYAIRAISS